jgi:hypothetical protein
MLPILVTYCHAGFLLGLFFDPENEDHIFLRNVGWLSTHYAALYPKRRNSWQNYCSHTQSYFMICNSTFSVSKARNHTYMEHEGKTERIFKPGTRQTWHASFMLRPLYTRRKHSRYPGRVDLITRLEEGAKRKICSAWCFIYLIWYISLMRDGTQRINPHQWYWHAVSTIVVFEIKLVPEIKLF